MFAGLTRGSIYAIVAIGFNIIYNTTGIINFAQGEFLILGAMISVSLSFFLPVWLAILCAVLITAFFGTLVEVVFIKYNRNFSVLRMTGICILVFIILRFTPLFSPMSPLPAFILSAVCAVPLSFILELLFKRYRKEANVLRLIIITIGISIFTREAMLNIWDEKVRALPFFTGNEVSSFSFLGAQFSPQILWVLAVCALIVLGLVLFFKYTLAGKAMRACNANKNAARLCGINAQLMVTISFIISASIGAIAGCIISPLTQTQYNMGAPLAIKGFTVAILGGLGNSFAAVAGGLLLGVAESFSVSIIPNAFKDIVAIVILLIVLFIKPSGLFGSQEESALKDF